MKNIKNLFLLAMMVLASITIAPSPARAQNQNNLISSDHDILIQIQADQKGIRNEVLARFEASGKQTDDLRKDMNSRFEMQEKIFDRMNYLFGGITLFLFGLIIYDRRNLLKPLEKRVKPLEDEMKILKADKSLATMWEWAKIDPKFAEFLKTKNML